MNVRDYHAVIGVPGGAIGMRCSDREIVGIDFLPTQPDCRPTNDLAAEAVRQLRAWLVDPSFRFELPLASVGTIFQNRVWRAIEAIRCGETRSYGNIARDMGTAPRAVGQACGANPYPIIVPCHRVISSTPTFNGGLGGFANSTGGYLLDIKRRLLAHEASVSCISLFASPSDGLEARQRPAKTVSAY